MTGWCGGGGRLGCASDAPSSHDMPLQGAKGGLLNYTKDGSHARESTGKLPSGPAGHDDAALGSLLERRLQGGANSNVYPLAGIRQLVHSDACRARPTDAAPDAAQFADHMITTASGPPPPVRRTAAAASTASAAPAPATFTVAGTARDASQALSGSEAVGLHLWQGPNMLWPRQPQVGTASQLAGRIAPYAATPHHDGGPSAGLTGMGIGVGGSADGCTVSRSSAALPVAAQARAAQQQPCLPGAQPPPRPTASAFAKAAVAKAEVVAAWATGVMAPLPTGLVQSLHPPARGQGPTPLAVLDTKAATRPELSCGDGHGAGVGAGFTLDAPLYVPPLPLPRVAQQPSSQQQTASQSLPRPRTNALGAIGGQEPKRRPADADNGNAEGYGEPKRPRTEPAANANGGTASSLGSLEHANRCSAAGHPRMSAGGWPNGGPTMPYPYGSPHSQPDGYLYASSASLCTTYASPLYAAWSFYPPPYYPYYSSYHSYPPLRTSYNGYLPCEQRPSYDGYASYDGRLPCGGCPAPVAMPETARSDALPSSHSLGQQGQSVSTPNAAFPAPARCACAACEPATAAAAATTTFPRPSDGALPPHRASWHGGAPVPGGVMPLPYRTTWHGGAAAAAAAPAPTPGHGHALALQRLSSALPAPPVPLPAGYLAAVPAGAHVPRAAATFGSTFTPYAGQPTGLQLQGPGDAGADRSGLGAAYHASIHPAGRAAGCVKLSGQQHAPAPHDGVSVCGSTCTVLEPFTSDLPCAQSASFPDSVLAPEAAPLPPAAWDVLVSAEAGSAASAADAVAAAGGATDAGRSTASAVRIEQVEAIGIADAHAAPTSSAAGADGYLVDGDPFWAFALDGLDDLDPCLFID